MQSSKVIKGTQAKWNETFSFVVDHTLHKSLLVELLAYHGATSPSTIVASLTLPLDTMSHSDQWHTLNSQLKFKKGKKNVVSNESIHLSTSVQAPVPVTTPRLAEAQRILDESKKAEAMAAEAAAQLAAIEGERRDRARDHVR